MSADDEGFLRRWARRKRAAVVSGTPVSPAPPAAHEPVEEPPPLDTLPLEEVTAWLRRNVPEAWRVAALRRVWSGDPAIRDFIGPADYAWDWNTPGAAPGWGALDAGTDLKRLLARAIGEPEDTPPAPEDPPAPSAEAAVPMAEAAMPAEDVPVPPEPPKPAPAGPVRRRGGRAAPA